MVNITENHQMMSKSHVHSRNPLSQLGEEMVFLAGSGRRQVPVHADERISF